MTAPHSPRMLEIQPRMLKIGGQGCLCGEALGRSTLFRAEVHTLSCDSRDENDKAVNLRILGRSVPPAFRH